MTERIEVFTQSSIRIRSDRWVVYVDPFRMRGEPHDADYVFITHDHYDHFSPEDLEKVCGEKTVLIVPETMEEKAEAEAPAGIHIMTVQPGSVCWAGDLEFETVPAYNRIRPFHPRKAGWVGYILNLDGQRIYVAGDTDATEEARQVHCDIALVPIGGTYTMNAKQAAALINAIKPALAIPTHYGSIVGTKADADVFRKNVEEDITVSVRIQD